MPPSADSPLWLGVDLGTQSVRAMAVSLSGEVAGAGVAKLHSTRDGNRHEQDPAEWWQASSAAIQQALADLAPERVQGIAVDGTSGTILLADAEARPWTAGIMYDDTRSAGEVARINETGGELWSELGYGRMQPSWALPKLLWLLRKHPDLLGKGLRLLHQTDFLNQRLTGHRVATDYSNALKTGCNLRDGNWPSKIMAALGIPEACLPPLVPPGTLLGVVCADASAATRLSAGTPVYAGMTDGCAAQLGSGPLTVGSWNVVLGTTMVFKGVSAELIRDPAGVLYSHRGPHGRWLPGGASSTGAGCFGKYFPEGNLAALTSAAAAHGPSRTVAYPLAGTGERFPFISPSAEGFLLGSAGGDADLFSALLEGVAFMERLCFDYLDLLGAPTSGGIRFTGGAAQNAYWCQLRADILGRAISLPANAEAALGMAILAANATRSSDDAAKSMVRIKEVIIPRPDISSQYGAPFLKLLAALEDRGWLPAGLACHSRDRLATASASS